MYDFNLLTPLDLLLLSNPQDFIHKERASKEEFVRKLHEKVKMQMQQQSERYAKERNWGKRELIFEEGDWVWLHLSKDIFPKQRKSKFNSRDDRPFQVLKTINNNTYQLDFPEEY